MKNIYLIGFMATGKTAVGKFLARRLKKQFIDLDGRIEEKEGMRIVDIFAKKGEAYFRQAEKQAVKEIALLSDCIVACGGGVVIDPDNVVLLKKSGTLICLTADVATIIARSSGTKQRPLLNVGNPQEKILELLEKRKAFYKQADYEIDTSPCSVEDVAEKIINIIGKKNI